MSSFSADFDRVSDISSSRSTTRILISVIRKLSDHSSDPSLREDERIKLEGSYDVVDARLEKIVKAKQDGLNRTVSDFQKICSNVHSASEHLAKVKANLSACKEQIRCKREELKRLHNESEENNAVLDIFERIETISQMSQLVQECIENEQYVKAAEIIQQVSTNFEVLSEIPVVSNISFPMDIKEKLYSKIVEAIEFELYEQSIAALATESDFSRGVSIDSQSGIFAQSNPQMFTKLNTSVFRKPIINELPQAERNSSAENVEATLTELVKALSVLGKLRDASGVLQSHFTAKIENLLQCTLLEVVNNTSQRPISLDESNSHLLNKHEQKLTWLFEILQSKLIKIVEHQNLFIQKMNVALLQAEKSSSCSSIYSISTFLITFQATVINLLEQLLNENSGSFNSGAERYYSKGAISSGSSLLTGATGSRLTGTLLGVTESRGASGDSASRNRPFVSFAPSINRTSLQNSPARLRTQSSSEIFPSSAGGTVSKQGSPGANKISNFLNAACSILNIKAFYNTLEEMCCYISVQMGCEKNQCMLHENVQKYIDDNLQSYLTHKIKDTLENKIARDSIGSIESSRSLLTKLDSDKPLAQSCILAYELLSYLANISKQLPDFSELFTNLVSHFLGSFNSRVHPKYISMFSRQGAAREEATSTSLKLIGDKDVSVILGSIKGASQFRLVQDESPGKASSKLMTANTEELVSKLMTSLNEASYNGKLRTITDVKQYSELFQVLSVLSYSINWLVTKTRELVDNFGPNFSQSQNCGDVGKRQTPLGADLNRSINDLKVIADNCLIGFHLELKVVTFSQLTSLLKNSKSSGSNQLAALELHDEVKDLSRLYSEAGIAAAKFLPEPEINFLFSSLPLFIQNIYLSNSTNIANTTQFELDLLLLDVLELKRLLQKTNLADKESWARSNEAFDKITSFYEFLRYPPKDIIRIANQKKMCFQKDMWTVLLNASFAKFGISGDAELSTLLNDLKDVTSSGGSSSVRKTSTSERTFQSEPKNNSLLLNGTSQSSSAL